MHFKTKFVIKLSKYGIIQKWLRYRHEVRHLETILLYPSFSHSTPKLPSNHQIMALNNFFCVNLITNNLKMGDRLLKMYKKYDSDRTRTCNPLIRSQMP